MESGVANWRHGSFGPNHALLLGISNQSGTNPGIRVVALVPIDAVGRARESIS